MSKTANNTKKKQGSGTFSITTRILRVCAPGARLRIAWGMVLLLAASASALLQPWPLKLVLDSVVGNQPPPAWILSIETFVSRHVAFASNPKLALLVLLCLAILLLQSLVGAFTVWSTYVLVDVGLRMVFKLRCAVFNHIQRLSLSFHDATSVGDSLYRVAWDTYCVQELFNEGVIPALTSLVTLIGIASIMFSVNWIVTCVALAVGAPLALLIRRIDKPMTAFSLRVHERESAISDRVQETLSSIRAVQAFGREDYEDGRFRKHAAASMRASLRLTVLQAGSQATVDLLLALGTALVVGIAAAETLGGHLTAGDLVLLVAYVAMLYKPLETLTYTAATVQSASAGAKRVLTVLDAIPDIADTVDARDLVVRAAGQLDFEHVSFGYKHDRLALNNVSFHVPAGSSVALVGASGAGKTTVASLLLRFYDPVVGSIKLDGTDLRSLTLKSLRRNLAIVLQEPILFSATMRENIAYAHPEATFDDIQAAAQAADAHEFIVALPQGYDTQIGERGVTLSGGQKQRLSIARAFLKDAPILILDEPTSALDAQTEQNLLEALTRLMKHRTTIIIAHRLSTIRNAGNIIVLKHGAIIEEGPLPQLLRQQGPFKQLYDSQVGAIASTPP